MKRTARWKLAQSLELKWWRRYLKDKSPETYLDWKRKYWIEFLEKIQVNKEDLKGLEVLDAGCGPAGIFIALEESLVRAMDPLLLQYEKELAHFERVNYPYVAFENNTIELITLKERFDAIFCLNAINHVADIDLAYDKLIGSAKPGALIVVSIDAHNKGFFKGLFRLTQGDVLHPHQYNLKEYEKFLTDRGCKIQNAVLIKKGFFFDYWVQVAVKS